MVEDGDEAWREYALGSAASTAKLESVCERLIERLSFKAEYSAAARATLKGLRSNNRPWLDTVLDAA
jgi:hypothetical protein